MFQCKVCGSRRMHQIHDTWAYPPTCFEDKWTMKTQIYRSESRILRKGRASREADPSNWASLKDQMMKNHCTTSQLKDQRFRGSVLWRGPLGNAQRGQLLPVVGHALGEWTAAQARACLHNRYHGYSGDKSLHSVQHHLPPKSPLANFQQLPYWQSPVARWCFQSYDCVWDEKHDKKNHGNIEKDVDGKTDINRDLAMGDHHSSGQGYRCNTVQDAEVEQCAACERSPTWCEVGSIGHDGAFPDAGLVPCKLDGSCSVFWECICWILGSQQKRLIRKAVRAIHTFHLHAISGGTVGSAHFLFLPPSSYLHTQQ